MTNPAFYLDHPFTNALGDVNKCICLWSFLKNALRLNSVLDCHFFYGELDE